MTYVVPPYTPERIESLRTSEPHNAGDPAPNDVAFANALAILAATEDACCQPDEVGLDAIGGLAMYWDRNGLNVHAFNSGAIVALVPSVMPARAVACPAVVTLLAQRPDRRRQFDPRSP